MTLTRKILFAAVCSLLSAFRYSAIAGEWKDIFAAALKNNPSLEKSRIDVSIAESNYLRAFSGFLPHLSASASVENFDSAGAAVSASRESYSYSYGLSGNISLFKGFAGVSEVAIKRADLSIAKLRLQRKLSDIWQSTRRSFIELLWAQEAAKLSQEIKTRRVKNFELVKVKYEAGIEDKGSMLRVEADKFQAEFDAVKAKRYMETAAAALSKEIGADSLVIAAVSGDFLLRHFSDYGKPDMRALLEKIPDYAAAAAAVEKSSHELKRSRSSFYPEISAGGTILRSGTSFGSIDDESRKVNISLVYRFFQGGRNFIDDIISKANSEVIRREFYEKKLSLIYSMVASWNSFEDAVGNIAVREKYLAAAAQQAEIISSKYLNGIARYQDWYQVENDYINAQRALLNAKREAGAAEAAWRNIIGLGE